jgi:WD40 repeat protein
LTRPERIRGCCLECGFQLRREASGQREPRRDRSDLGRKGEVSTLTLHGHRTLLTAAFSPDGQRIATGDRDGLVQFWDVDTGREVLELTGAAVGEGIDSLAFSSDGRYLAVRGDQAVRLYVVPIHDLTSLAVAP